jgi:hypothetical protein
VLRRRRFHRVGRVCTSADTSLRVNRMYGNAPRHGTRRGQVVLPDNTSQSSTAARGVVVRTVTSRTRIVACRCTAM